MVFQLVLSVAWQNINLGGRIFTDLPITFTNGGPERLGSVFRSILISACIGESQDTADLFYKSVKFPEITVFDPFMGSGTTIGEAIKKAMRGYGQGYLNPVSYFLVSTAVQNYERKDVIGTYEKLKSDVGSQILSFYKTDFPSGKEANILYYFSVNTANCPNCGESVDLLRAEFFLKMRRPKKIRLPGRFARIVQKSTIFYTIKKRQAAHIVDFPITLKKGRFQDDKVTSPVYEQRFKFLDIVKATGKPLAHRMYAKLVLTDEDKKVYLPIDQSDQLSYTKAEDLLERMWEKVPAS